MLNRELSGLAVRRQLKAKTMLSFGDNRYIFFFVCQNKCMALDLKCVFIKEKSSMIVLMVDRAHKI